MNPIDLINLAFANAPFVALVALLAIVGMIGAFVAKATPGGIETPALDPTGYWAAAA